LLPSERAPRSGAAKSSPAQAATAGVDHDRIRCPYGGDVAVGLEALQMSVNRRTLSVAAVVAAIAATAAPSAGGFAGRNGAFAHVDDASRLGRITISMPSYGAVAQIERPGVEFTHPRWAPDGTRLLVTGSSSADGRQLWLADVTSEDWQDPSAGVTVTRLRRLTAPGDGDNSDGSWSPDGRQIAYVHTADDGVPQVWRMPADGRGGRRLAWSKMGSADPDWSPDGSEIAFTTWPVNAADRGPRIFAMNAADGTHKRKISITPGRRPAWSPDGTRLTFEAVAPVSGIEVVRRDGQQERTLGTAAYDPHIQLLWPRWSPDGTRIVYIWDGRARVPRDPNSYRQPAFMSPIGAPLYSWDILYGTDADWGPLPATTGGLQSG